MYWYKVLCVYQLYFSCLSLVFPSSLPPASPIFNLSGMEKDLSSFWTIIVNSSTPGNPEIYNVTIFGHKIYDCYIFTIPFINKYKQYKLLSYWILFLSNFTNEWRHYWHLLGIGLIVLALLQFSGQSWTRRSYPIVCII